MAVADPELPETGAPCAWTVACFGPTRLFTIVCVQSGIRVHGFASHRDQMDWSRGGRRSAIRPLVTPLFTPSWRRYDGKLGSPRPVAPLSLVCSSDPPGWPGRLGTPESAPSRCALHRFSAASVPGLAAVIHKCQSLAWGIGAPFTARHTERHPGLSVAIFWQGLESATRGLIRGGGVQRVPLEHPFRRGPSF